MLEKARVCTSHPLILSEQMWRSWSTAVEDYLISEQQDAHVERCLRFLLDEQHCQQILLSTAPKLLTAQRLWKTRKETKGEHLLALPATCNNLWHRRERTERPAVPAQHTNRRACLVSVLCATKQVQWEAETTQGRERIRQFHVCCRFADATQKLCHTPN